MIKTSENYICIAQATKLGYITLAVFPSCVDCSYPRSKTRRGRIQDGGTVSPTLTRNGGQIYVFEERGK